MIKLSVAIVALNEEKFLPSLFEDLLSQTYNHSFIEILLIDGGSNDKTKIIMDEFAMKYEKHFNKVSVLNNPDKIQAAGWNVAIRNYGGDALARIDAHSRIDKYFCEKVVENLNNDEFVVGGQRPSIVENDTKWSKTMLQVESSLFGSNILKSRRSTKKQYVKTMFHATYRREVLDSVGYFNENLLRTEDNEFHYRIRKQGYKLCYDPDIISYQYIRGSFKQMIKQKSGNGFWIGETIKFCPRCISIYHLIPFFFVICLFAFLVLIPFGLWYLSVALLGLYFLFAVTNTIFSGIKKGFYLYHFIMPFIFFVLHISYGVGTLLGLIKIIKRKK